VGPFFKVECAVAGNVEEVVGLWREGVAKYDV
jgi:hypothetical protein